MLAAFAHASTFEVASIAAACTAVGGALAGLFFRGAAAGWKDERDAAVAKADRLEQRVNEQDAQITSLKAKVADLEKHNVEQIAAQVGRLVDQIAKLASVVDRLDVSMHANTAAVEVVARGSVIKDALTEHDNEGAS